MKCGYCGYDDADIPIGVKRVTDTEIGSYKTKTNCETSCTLDPKCTAYHSYALGSEVAPCKVYFVKGTRGNGQVNEGICHSKKYI